MLTENWFQSWHPPSSIIPGPAPFQVPLQLRGNFSPTYNNYAYPSKNSNTGNGPDLFLPYLLSLSVFKYKEDVPNLRSGQERTGPFRTVYHWSRLDFAYPTEQDRNRAIFYGDYIPDNNLLLGLEVWKERLFVTMPKWKPGVPATLAVLPRKPKESSPRLVPYPSWEWHQTDTCDGIVSVFRVQADSCGRLWVLDSGQINITIKPVQVCPPKLLIFNLQTDQLIVKYELPDEFVKQDGLFSNILVDIRDDCYNVFAYLTDVWRFNLVVFSLAKMHSWIITNHLFFPEPLAATYKVEDLEFEWTDGLFGMSLSPYSKYDSDRILYFHPMSSFREFYVKTSIICDENGSNNTDKVFQVLGQSRGKSGHVSASWMDRNGVMIFNMVTRNTIGCWDSRKPYKRSNLGVIARSSETLVFPNDLKIDQEKRQSAWIITNKLPFYLYRSLDEHHINFRVMAAYVDEAIKGTICDPKVVRFGSFMKAEDDDCY